jgi:hypothetical protein
MLYRLKCFIKITYNEINILKNLVNIEETIEKPTN